MPFSYSPMRVKSTIVVGLLTFLPMISTKSQPVANTEKKFLLNLFKSEELLKATLEADFRTLRKNKYEEEYQPAIIRFFPDSLREIEDTIRIRPRGNMRKKHCLLPPLRLNFKKSSLLPDSTTEFEKLKLVTHCQSSSIYEIYLLKEYLIYKIYNLISPLSLKARLLELTYIDTGRKRPKSLKRFAFILEDIDQLADNTNCIEIDAKWFIQKNLDQQHVTLMSVFQFMIGNTDWSIPGLHNIKLLKSKDHLQPAPFAVPYDFDYAGFVNTDYAVPSDKMGIEKVTQRLYRGFCKTHQEYERAFEIFRTKKPGIIELIEDFPYLRDKDKYELLSYVEDFYTIINDPSLVNNYFIQNCRTNQDK